MHRGDHSNIIAADIKNNHLAAAFNLDLISQRIGLSNIRKTPPPATFSYRIPFTQGRFSGPVPRPEVYQCFSAYDSH